MTLMPRALALGAGQGEHGHERVARSTSAARQLVGGRGMRALVRQVLCDVRLLGNPTSWWILQVPKPLFGFCCGLLFPRFLSHVWCSSCVACIDS